MRKLNGPVLAAIDLTGTSTEVLQQANAIALSLNTKLVIGHVLHEIFQARVLFPQLSQLDLEAQSTFEQRARQAVGNFVETAANPAATDVEIVFESGSPHAGILSLIERIRPGLVVLGAGETALRVTRYAPCDVLIARPSKPGCVLGATDFSDPSVPAIETAASEAARRKTALRLMYCLEFGEPVLLGSPTIAIGVLPALPGSLAKQLERDARERFSAILNKLGISGECIVTPQRPALGIVQAAKDVETELIVVGMRGRSNISRLLLGSVSESVIHHAPCSVLVTHLPFRR